MSRIIILLIFISALLACTDGKKREGLRGIVDSSWKNFWSYSCQFSNVISRSKRSLDRIPGPGEPPEKYFEYLYPSAHIRREDLILEGERSTFSSRTFTTWIDDALDLWQTECNQRKEAEAREETVGPATTPTSPFLSLLNPSLAAQMNSTVPYKNGTDLISSRDPHRNVTSRQVTDGQPFPPLPTLISWPTQLPTIPPLPTPSNLVLKQVDKFFPQYGGDIEYFIPLVGFGLPFDGEITVLGFHGFKGLFPYR